MKTVTININNRNDTLTQLEWSKFINDIDSELCEYKLGSVFIFSGGTNTDSSTQKYCWVIELQSLNDLVKRLNNIRKKYHNNPIFLTIGDTTSIHDEA